MAIWVVIGLTAGELLLSVCSLLVQWAESRVPFNRNCRPTIQECALGDTERA